MTFRDGLIQRGRLVESLVSRLWVPLLTEVDPIIPYLPVETAATPPAPSSGLRRLLLGCGI